MRRVAGAMSKTQVTAATTPLTNRETQVLRHVALGLSNKEIGRSLTISIETVKEHVQNILRKIAGQRSDASGRLGRPQRDGIGGRTGGGASAGNRAVDR